MAPDPKPPQSPISGADLVPVYFPGTGRSYDRVVRWTTLGRDAAWKRRIVESLPPCRAILELACGTGILSALLLERNPGARLVGVDVTEDYLAVARERFRDGGRDVQFVLGDAAKTPVAHLGPFDAVVSCYIPKYVDAEELVATITPAVRPGGVAVLHDFTRPNRIVPRVLWRAWFAVLNVFAPLFHPEWKKVFDSSLTRLIRETRWVRQFRDAFVAHGWEGVWAERQTYGAATIVFARRPGGSEPRP